MNVPSSARDTFAVVLAPEELLERVAGTLRRTVGPAVEEPIATTQAFMAAVILEKVAGDLRAAATGGDDHRRDVGAAVRAELVGGATADVAAAVDRLERDGTSASWRALVEALYASQAELGDDRFAAALAHVRAGLRARLDRALAANP